MATSMATVVPVLQHLHLVVAVQRLRPTEMTQILVTTTTTIMTKMPTIMLTREARTSMIRRGIAIAIVIMEEENEEGEERA